jgi:hypothetical protein
MEAAGIEPAELDKSSAHSASFAKPTTREIRCQVFYCRRVIARPSTSTYRPQAAQSDEAGGEETRGAAAALAAAECAGKSPPPEPEGLARRALNGGGGNRTRVREPLRKSLYKLRLPLRFARRPVGSRPTAGLAILWCRTSGDWLSVGAEPVF